MKRYRLKKKFIVLFIIIIVGIISLIVLLNIKDSKISINKELFRTIKIDTDKELDDLIYKVEDNKIKYLIQNKNDIKFNSYDITTNKTNIIGELKDYNYCYDSNNESVVCYKESDDFESNGDYYSFDMKKINKTKIENEENYNTFIESSKGIVKEDGTNLYLNDSKVTEINGLGYLLEVFETDNDLFYLFNESNNYTVLKNSNLEKTTMQYRNYFKYNDGYIFRTGKEYAIFDLKNNKLNKYNYDSLEENGDYYNNLVYKDELIVIDSNNSRIIFEQPKTSKMYIYNVDNVKKITNAKVYNNYLIFIGTDTNNLNIYLLNLDLLKKEYITYKEYSDNISIENSELIKKIKEKYNVNILIKDEYKKDFEEFKIDYTKYEDSIKNSLNIIEKTLSEYKKESFDYFVDENYTGLYIFITGHISYKGDLSDFKASANTFEEDDKHLILIDSNDISDNNLKHELMHSFDRTLIDKKQDRIDFEKYNPKDFEYTFDYNVSGKQEYIKSNDDASDNVYFPNGYGTSNRQEDVATVYESVCALNLDLKKYPKIEKKFNYIKETMIKNIPGIAESKCFKN